MPFYSSEWMVNQIYLHSFPPKFLFLVILLQKEVFGACPQNLRGHCFGRNWKARPSSEVMGSEASVVIIFDMHKVHFESVSRAVKHLIFITTAQNKR